MKRLLLPLLLVVAFLVHAVDMTDFTRCVEITVSYMPGEPLSDFPALVRLGTSISGFDYADFKLTDGGDLRFLDADGNVLSHEIDTWNPGGMSLVWVRIPTLENDARIRCCYGCAQPVAAPSPDSVWTKYIAVIHGGGGITNAVGNEVLATAGSTNVTADAGAGKVGGGIHKSSYNSIGLNVTKPSDRLADAGKFSVSGWFKRSGNGGSNGNGTFILGASRHGWDKGTGYLWLQEQGKYISVAANSSHQWSSGSYTLPKDDWGHVAFSYESGVSLKSYFNGATDQTKSSPGNLTSTAATWTFGSYQNTASNDSFAGDMDELRIYDGVVGAAWIAAEYAAVADGSFLSYGKVFSPSSANPIISSVSATPGYTNVTLSVSVLGLGDGATGGTATIELATDEVFASLVGTRQFNVTAMGQTVSATFDHLSLEPTYYARAYFTNNLDAAVDSETTMFSTIDANPVFSTFVNTDHIAPNISLLFSSAGFGGAVTRIVVDVSTSDDFSDPALSKIYEVNLATMPTNVNDIVLTGLPTASPLHYRFTVVNSSGYGIAVEEEAANPVGDGNNVWSGLSEDISDPNAYVFEGGLPVPGKTLYFTKPAGLSPVVDTDTTMPMLRFMSGQAESVDTSYQGGYHSCGYNFSGSGVLTFTDEKPILQASYGTNVISNPIRFSRSNSQTVTISSVGEDNAWLDLNGRLLLPDGVSNTTMKVTGRGNTVLGGASPDFMGQLSVEGGRLTFANPCAMTNVSKLYFTGDPTSISNAIGAPLVFPRVSSIWMDNGWPGRKLHEYGAPFVFPQATFEWGIRDYNQSTFEADWVVSNVVVRKHGSNGDACGTKTGAGAFIVKGETTWYDSSVKSYIRLYRGCFCPMTAAGLPPSGEFYLPNDHAWRSTFGLSGDFSPMLDGSSTPRFFQTSKWACWGFTGFGGDRAVCWDADPTLNLTNTTSGTVEIPLGDAAHTNVAGKAYSDYYAYPPYFMFGNRSEFADGTILFLNPIRYELGQDWDATTRFESTNHVVAARLRGSLKLGTGNKTWNFSGNSFGGYLALEADNSDFTGKVNVCDKGNLLVNSNLVARSVTVQSGAGLGGTGELSTVDGTTVKSGGSLFGGEWNKGGTLTLNGKVTLESGSALRVEAGASDDCRGCVKLAAGSTLKLTAPVYVDVDTDPRVSPVRGASCKVLDWSEASFESGAAPTREDFVARPENNPDLKKISFSVRDDGLYVGYVSVRCPQVFRINIR